MWPRLEFLKSFLARLTRFLVIARSNTHFSSDFEWGFGDSISRTMFFRLNESCVLGCKVGCKNSDFNSRWAKKTWFPKRYPKNSTRIRQTIMWSNFLSPNSSLNGPETTSKRQKQWKSCSQHPPKIHDFALVLTKKHGSRREHPKIPLEFDRQLCARTFYHQKSRQTVQNCLQKRKNEVFFRV